MEPVHPKLEMNGSSSITNGFHSEDELDFQRETLGSEILESMSALQKNQKFCDVKFVVDNHEVVAHRAVLAAQSATLFDILAKEDEATQSMIKLKDVTFKGFMYLLDYMYTGRLRVPSSDVCEAYGMARRLRLHVPAQACADFLSSTLTPDNCLAVRTVAEDEVFQGKVNGYIQDNLGAVLQSKSFFTLPNFQLEVVGTDETMLLSVKETHLFEMALEWVKQKVQDGKPSFHRLTEKVHVLCFGPGNNFQECNEVDEPSVKEDLVIQDYKKLIRKQTGLNDSPASGKVAASTPPSSKEQSTFHKFSLKSENRNNPREWSIVATSKWNQHSYVSLLMLNGHLIRMSLHFRAPQNSPDHSGSEGGPDSPVHLKTNSMERLASLEPIGTLSIPRCAFGIRAVQGKIIACGGYDRGEVMKSAEEYDPATNTWHRLPDMNQPRCRFTAAHLNGKIYAIGGSDGHNELSSVECYDPQTQKWSRVASLSQARASPGVAVLKGKIFCVGGSSGQKSLRKCEVYDPDTDSWSPTASLKTGRFQACVRAFKNRLYAAGGTDGWNVFSTVEVFRPESQTWESGPPLSVARRGAGIEAFNGKLYIVGGSDGTQSLKTTESFDPEEQVWTFNPVLNIPRANVGAAVLDNKLFAVGGFSGKKFLDSIEYFDVEQQEWCSYNPFIRSRTASLSSDSDVNNDGAQK